jgi:hypothetical protein
MIMYPRWQLGQFIASSPTIFPPEFVLEFQKCLDQTEPVPFGKRGEALYAAPSHWSHANSGCLADRARPVR